MSVSIGSQSPDIVQGVNSAVKLCEGNSERIPDAQNAGGQGMMCGFGGSETPKLTPLPITHCLTRRLSAARKDGTSPTGHRRPDGRHRPHQPQDHYRHVRGLRPARRQRVLRNDETVRGGPLCRAFEALRRQKRDRGRVRPTAARPRSPTPSARPTRSACSSRPSAQNVPVERIERVIHEAFDLRPAPSIRDLDLPRPVYLQTAAYGHFGREVPELLPQTIDRAQNPKNAAT